MLKAQVQKVWTGLKEEHQPFAVERLRIARDGPLRDRFVGTRVPGQERGQRGAGQPRDAAYCVRRPRTPFPAPCVKSMKSPKTFSAAGSLNER